MRLVFTLFGLLLGGFVVASVVARASDIPAPQIDLVMSAIDAIIIAGFAVARPATVGPWLRNSGLDAMGAVETLAAISVFFSGAFVYFGVLRLLDLPLLGYLDEFRGAGWPLWSAYLLVCVYPAVFEEIAFRGFILGQLDKVLPAREALLVQAAMFSVLHISPIIFVSHFLMGLVLGILRRRRASLYPSMLVHMLWNAVVITQEALALS